MNNDKGMEIKTKPEIVVVGELNVDICESGWNILKI